MYVLYFSSIFFKKLFKKYIDGHDTGNGYLR